MESKPTDWPKDAPTYHSVAGWEFEKKLVYEQLKKQLQNANISGTKRAVQ